VAGQDLTINLKTSDSGEPSSRGSSDTSKGEESKKRTSSRKSGSDAGVTSQDQNFNDLTKQNSEIFRPELFPATPELLNLLSILADTFTVVRKVFLPLRKLYQLQSSLSKLQSKNEKKTSKSEGPQLGRRNPLPMGKTVDAEESESVTSSKENVSKPSFESLIFSAITKRLNKSYTEGIPLGPPRKESSLEGIPLGPPRKESSLEGIPQKVFGPHKRESSFFADMMQKGQGSTASKSLEVPGLSKALVNVNEGLLAFKSGLTQAKEGVFKFSKFFAKLHFSPKTWQTLFTNAGKGYKAVTSPGGMTNALGGASKFVAGNFTKLAAGATVLAAGFAVATAAVGLLSVTFGAGLAAIRSFTNSIASVSGQVQGARAVASANEIEASVEADKVGGSAAAEVISSSSDFSIALQATLAQFTSMFGPLISTIISLGSSLLNAGRGLLSIVQIVLTPVLALIEFLIFSITKIIDILSFILEPVIMLGEIVSNIFDWISKEESKYEGSYHAFFDLLGTPFGEWKDRALEGKADIFSKNRGIRVPRPPEPKGKLYMG
jgi:hypothetical protein